jgi:hypothetical protein
VSASPLNAAEDNALSAAIGLPGEVTSGAVLMAHRLCELALGRGAWLMVSWYKQTNSHSADGDWRRGPNEESASIFLIMISPAFADDRNVYDFDPLNFKFE